MAVENKQKRDYSSKSKIVFSNRLKITVILVPVILLLVLIIAAAPGALKREHRYRDASALLNEGELDAAEEAFSQIPSYRDSDEIVSCEIPYLRACRLYSAARESDESMLQEAGISASDLNNETTVSMLLFQAAADAFHELGNYRDSPELENQCYSGIEAEKERLFREDQDKKQAMYDAALALLDKGSYSEATQQFLALSDFQDSKEMVHECLYRKAVSLYHFISRYDIGRIYASITIDPGQTSIFSLPANEALRLGSGCVDDLRAACGQDLTDIRLEDTPDSSLLSLKDALCEIFHSLGSYADSSEYLPKIEAATDYTRDFYMLCSTGDLPAALSWLNSYQGVFPDRDRWTELLNLYLPYCGTWALYLGDSTLLAYSTGQSFPCMNVSSRVILTEDEVFLRLSFGDGSTVNFDLPSTYGETLFINTEPESGIYMAAINNGHFVYMRYDRNWNLLSSSDYIPT